MKIIKWQFSVVGILMITAGLLHILQAITGGDSIYLGFHSGVEFEPGDLAAFLAFLAWLLLPYSITTLFAGKWRMLALPIAFVLSVGIFLEFPLKFTAELKSDAYYADGTPMGIKGTDAWFGHIPYWKSHFVEFNYPPNDTGERWVYAGNGYWGKHYRYNLIWTKSDMKYECITWETTHFFGYFARDERGGSLEYWPESKLPKDKCKLVKKITARSTENEEYLGSEN